MVGAYFVATVRPVSLDTDDGSDDPKRLETADEDVLMTVVMYAAIRIIFNMVFDVDDGGDKDRNQ